MGLRSMVLPPGQRRTLEELTDDLDLRVGDTRSKQSAFWTMLTLSAVIATAGVMADSTATVIGAMIIAPLSTPIMGIALGLVKRQGSGSLGFVLLGALLVIAVGFVFSFALPGWYDLADNAQISGRTSPTVLDLIAALATGLAGAIALARRDVAAVLPGVAIAISLVPPLAVVGVCLGHGSAWLALGALLLFLSNLVALVLAGTVMFAILGYAAESATSSAGPARKTYLTLTLLVTAVLLPLGANTAVAFVASALTERVSAVASRWVTAVPGARLTGVDVAGAEVVIHVTTPGDLPPTSALLTALEGEIPNGVPIVVDTLVGERLEIGSVGG